MPMTPVVLLAQEVEAPDRAVIGTDAAGRIVYWGPGAERMYGWAGDEVMGRLIVDVTPSELSREQADAIMETLVDGHPWAGDFVVRDRHGRRFEARVTDIPVHDREGKLLGIVGVSRRIVPLDRTEAMPLR